MSESNKMPLIKLTDCIVCKSDATIMGVFLPDNPSEFFGKSKIAYGLCESCFRCVPPNEVEDIISKRFVSMN